MIAENNSRKTFLERADSGELAIIPVGFRCWTKQLIGERTGLWQESFVFDSGFFPPAAIASILKNPEISLIHKDSGSQNPCIKYENFHDENLGTIIRFKRSSYDEIETLAKSPDQPGINKYLDNTFGYYTLDERHKFVLAHFNWHRFSDVKHSNGIHDPSINLKNAENVLNRRIKRVLHKCEHAKHIFFIHHERQGYGFMKIDDQIFDLNDFDELMFVARRLYGRKVVLIDANSIATGEDLLDLIK